MNENPNKEASPETTPPNTPATPTPPQPAPANSGELTSTGLAPNVAAGLCAVFPLVAGIVFMILEKKDALVKFWALQSVFFGVFSLVASIAVTVISFILGFIPFLGWLIASLLWLVLSLGLMALWIYSIVMAFQGRKWKMPIMGDMVEKQLSARPTT